MLSRTIAILTVLASAPSFANVAAYFNHNPNQTYTDTYRGITRSGDDLEQVIIDHIELAKKSVFIAVQELRLPRIAEALIAKKQAGVDVRVVLEHDYNSTVIEQQETSSSGDEYEASKLSELAAFVDINKDGKIDKSELAKRDAVYMLREAGIKIMDDTADGSSGSGLMHHKFMVVDKRYTVISTANFTLSCIHGDMLVPNSRGNANSLVAIKSPALAKVFDDEAQQLWGNGKRGNFGHNKTYRGRQSVKIGSTKITVQFSPTSSRYNWDETVNGLIGHHLKKTKNSVKAALFVYSDQFLSDLLEKRHTDGASLDFLVEPKFAFRNYSELLDMMGIRMLNQKCQYEANNRVWKNPSMSAGIPLLNRGDVLHHKFAVIDDKTVVVGSQNWSEAANYINDETLIVVENSDIVDNFSSEFDRLKQKSSQGIPLRISNEISRMEGACKDPKEESGDLDFPFYF